jgi:hypothetical protein
MVKVKGYRVNEPRKPADIFICNCKYGHQNCSCDGGKMIYRKCKECGQHNANLLDSVCFECREYEYQLNLGE